MAQDFWYPKGRIPEQETTNFGDLVLIRIPDACPTCGCKISITTGREDHRSTIIKQCGHFKSYQDIWDIRLNRLAGFTIVAGKCECGAEISNTTHSTWCPKYKVS